MRRTGAVHAGISCCVAGLLLGLAAAREARAADQRPAQPEIATRVVPLLQVDGFLFKDLNKNGRLDPYEDWRRPVERACVRPRRADDDRGEGGPDGGPEPRDGPRRCR